MQLASMSDLFGDVQLEAPGAPNPLVESRIRLAVTEICKRTLISNDTLSAHDIEAGEPLIYLSPPNACVKIWRVMWAKTSAGFLVPGERQQLSHTNSDWDTAEDEWPTCWLSHRQNDVIQLYPKPTATKADELIVHVAFIPHPQTTKIDAVLMDNYREMIVQGALAKLQRMPHTDWHNPEMAQWNEHQFAIEMSKAQANQGKDNSIAEVQVHMTPFA